MGTLFKEVLVENVPTQITPKPDCQEPDDLPAHRNVECRGLNNGSQSLFLSPTNTEETQTKPTSDEKSNPTVDWDTNPTF